MLKRFKLSVHRFHHWFLAATLIAVVVGVWQHQSIVDWFRLRSYDPPASVVQLAGDITLTDPARRLFYINHPALEDRQSFNSSCSSRGEQTIVLGCYHPVDRGIYVFHVSDDRLNGVDQVTAAHEMLHAAFDRLSAKERARVDTMLQSYSDHGLYDERIKSIVAAYRKSEPYDVVNEMHSVFGTEVAVLPPDLEAYYKQYFADRAVIVHDADAYEAEFTSRQVQVANDDTRLQAMKQQIDDNSAQLTQQEKQISSLRARLDSDRSSGNIDAYNANVPIYNGRIDSYNALIATTKSLITDYNQLVQSRNQIALQVADLAHSIDSSFQPIQQK